MTSTLPILLGHSGSTPGKSTESVSWSLRSSNLRAGPPGISLGDLQASCRRHSDVSLLEYGTRIEPRRTWDDLVLPAEQMAQLREMCLRLKHHYTVYDAWKLGRKVASGKGVSALFAGPSGTGKTTAAEIVAHELGQEAYGLDLSALVSKYIGETESLSKVFNAAERSNAVLFFDEADALFGKRSDVKDAHDRYANIQVAYLLQQIELYTGVSILASNLKANTDEAFIPAWTSWSSSPFQRWKPRRIWRYFLAEPLPVGSRYRGIGRAVSHHGCRYPERCSSGGVPGGRGRNRRLDLPPPPLGTAAGVPEDGPVGERGGRIYGRVPT